MKDKTQNENSEKAESLNGDLRNLANLKKRAVTLQKTFKLTSSFTT